MGTRRYGIVKKVGTSRGNVSDNFTSLLMEYLDASKKHRNDDISSSIWDGPCDAGDSVVEELDSSRLYWPPVTPFGYVKNQATSLFTNEEAKQRESLEHLNEWWLDSTKGKKVKYLHFVFSLSPAAQEIVSERSKDIGISLHYSVEEVFSRFNSFFYPEDSVGGVFGIHRDTDNLHAHVLLHPYTESGKRVGVSHGAKVRFGNTETRVDYQGYIKQAFNQALYDFCTPRNDDINRDLRGDHFNLSLGAAMILNGDDELEPLAIEDIREKIVSSKSAASKALLHVENEAAIFQSRFLQPEQNECMALSEMLIEACEDCEERVHAELEQITDFQNTIRISEKLREGIYSGKEKGEEPVGLVSGISSSDLLDSEEFTESINVRLSEKQEEQNRLSEAIRASSKSIEEAGRSVWKSLLDVSILSQGLSQELSVSENAVPRHLDVSEITDTSLSRFSMPFVKRELQHNLSKYSADICYKHRPFEVDTDGGKEFSSLNLVRPNDLPPEQREFRKKRINQDSDELPTSLNAFTNTINKPSMQITL